MHPGAWGLCALGQIQARIRQGHGTERKLEGLDSGLSSDEGNLVS